MNEKILREDSRKLGGYGIQMNYTSQIFEKSVLQKRGLDSQLELITSVGFYHYSDTKGQSNALVNGCSFEMVLISDEHSISNHEVLQ